MTNALTTPTALDLHRQLWEEGQTEARVMRAVRDAFRLPLEQQSYPGSVILRGRGGGVGDVRDVLELRNALREWLGDNKRTKAPSLPEMIGLIKKCRREAKRLIAGQLGRERVHGLILIYLSWLGATCSHKQTKTYPLGYGESFTLCVSCGSDVEGWEGGHVE